MTTEAHGEAAREGVSVQAPDSDWWFRRKGFETVLSLDWTADRFPSTPVLTFMKRHVSWSCVKKQTTGCPCPAARP